MPVRPMKTAVAVTERTTRAEGTQAKLRAAVRRGGGAEAVVQSLRERIGTLKLSSFMLKSEFGVSASQLKGTQLRSLRSAEGQL